MKIKQIEQAIQAEYTKLETKQTDSDWFETVSKINCLSVDLHNAKMRERTFFSKKDEVLPVYSLSNLN